MSYPQLKIMDTALIDFGRTLAPELQLAVASALRLMSSAPLNKTHSLIIYLSFCPTAKDFTTCFEVLEAEVLTHAEMASVWMQKDPQAHERIVKSTSQRDKILPTDVEDAMQAVMLLRAVDHRYAAKNTKNLHATRVSPMKIPDRRVGDQAQKEAIAALQEENWLEMLKRRTSVSGKNPHPGSVPPMSEREYARYKGVFEFR
ncbi:hypothetical protein RQP46_001455 [Phenoliferia psychrophenolica]